MPNSKKTTAPSQIDAPVTLSHETATFFNNSLNELFDPKHIGWTAKEINEDLLELLMYAMGSNFFEDGLQRHNLVYTLKQVIKFIYDVDSIRDDFKPL